MQSHIDGEPAVIDRFDQIEAILFRYPDIDEAELADLKRWFGKEASAFEVASLSCKQRVERQYAEFRAAHIDRFSATELVVGALVVVVLLAGIAAIALA